MPGSDIPHSSKRYGASASGRSTSDRQGGPGYPTPSYPIPNSFLEDSRKHDASPVEVGPSGSKFGSPCSPKTGLRDSKNHEANQAMEQAVGHGSRLSNPSPPSDPESRWGEGEE